MRFFALAHCIVVLLFATQLNGQSCLLLPVNVTKTDVSCEGASNGSILISSLPTNFTQDYFIIEIKNLSGVVIYSFGQVGFGASSINIPNLGPGLYDIKIDQYKREFINGKFELTELICRKTGSPQILSPGCDIGFTNLNFNLNPCDPGFGIASAKIKGTFCGSLPQTFRIINGVRDMTQHVFTVGSNYHPDTTYTNNQLNGLKPGDTVRFQLYSGDYLSWPGENIDSSICTYSSPTYVMPCDIAFDTIQVLPNSPTIHSVAGKVSSDYLCRYGSAYNFSLEVRNESNEILTSAAIRQDGSFNFNIAASYSQIRVIWKLSDRCKIEQQLNMPNSWIGGASNAWETPANWSQNEVPSANKMVFISNPSGVPKSININSNVQVKSLQLDAGVTLVLTPGKNLVITQ